MSTCEEEEGGSESASPWAALKFLRELEEIAKTRNRLPHWQQEGACYFITFRLADSLPKEKLRLWREERAAWLRHHPKPWDNAVELEYHKTFSGSIDRFMDVGHGSCILRDQMNAKIVADTLHHFDGTRYLLHTWVIMPNHVHLLVSLSQSESLEKIVSSWKRFSSKQLNDRNGTSGTLWQTDYFDRLIRDANHFWNVVSYIQGNPEKGKLKQGDYQLHTAPWIETIQGEADSDPPS
ncbi:MAG: transposase [Verrucomicrobia bacterium]|nr:transposase [Verrucomicrobiota bacterium]